MWNRWMLLPAYLRKKMVTKYYKGEEVEEVEEEKEASELLYMSLDQASPIT